MQSQEFTKLCKEIIEHGRELLRMDTGVVAHIHHGQYKIISVASNTNVFVRGDSYNIHGTICSHIAETQKTLTVNDFTLGLSAEQHPLYIPMTLKAIVATPIIHNKNVWGLLDFTSFTPHPKPFQNDQIRFVEESSAQLSKALGFTTMHEKN